MNDEHDMRAPDREPSSSGRPGTPDLIEQLLRDDPALGAAIEALPAALEPDAPSEASWQRLAAAFRADRATAGSAVARPVDDPRGGAGSRERARAPRRRTRWGPAHPLAWLAAAVIVGCVTGIGVWGVVQSAARTRLLEDQRVLAYWMANPDMRLVALRAVGESQPPAAGAAARLGVVCILPDGRALMLQPGAAGRGERFVVVGRGAGEDIDLVAGTSALLRFELAGAERLVVMVASDDGTRTPIAWAPVN